MGQQQSTSTDQRSFRRTVVVAFAWLFTALAMLALLSPPAASHDELYHATSIWCANGERDPYCERDAAAIAGGYARTNIDRINCQISLERPLICPTDQSGRGGALINQGLYPGVFYRTLGQFVVPSAEFSLVLIRWVNALIIVVFLTLAVLIFPSRYRTSLMLVLLSICNPFVFYLFASINPSSWSVLGVGVAWMAGHAAATQTAMSARQRATLMLLCLAGVVMAAGSRWDAAAFVAFTGVLVAVEQLWSRFPHRKLLLLGGASALTLAAVAIIGRFTFFSPVAEFRRLVEYQPGEPDNLAFFSHHLLQSIPRALSALGSVSSMTGIYIPQLVSILGVAVLVVLIGESFNTKSRPQIAGVAATVVLSTLVALAWQAQVDDRDPFNPETRYVLPLTVFAVGWFYAFGPVDLAQRVQKHLRWMAVVVTFAFGLTVLAIAERNVDFQTWGVRLIPEGPDQWWWSWMPIGPNVVVFVAVLSMWQFLRRFPALIAGPRTPL